MPKRWKNFGIAGILALTGCVSLIVVLGALFLGLWLDSMMGQRGPATIILMLASVPLSLFLMIRIALTLVKQLDPLRVHNPDTEVPSNEKEE